MYSIFSGLQEKGWEFSLNLGYTAGLRENSCFSIMKPRTELGKRSLKIFGIKLWISLPLSLKEMSEPGKFNYEFRKLHF